MATTRLTFEIPKRNLCAILTPKPLTGIKDSVKAIVDSLKRPVGTPSLAELINANDKIAIIVSDITRPCPTHKILPPLLRELKKNGIRYDNVSIVFATGIHRKQTPEEQKNLVGSNVFGKVKIFENDAEDYQSHQTLGVTSRGTSVSIDRRLVNCDFIIGVANIEIHYYAGYTGGAKSLLPGVASREAIQQNHSLLFQPGAQPGKADGNPVREDFEEAAKIAGLNFILNVVLNDKREITGVFSGDFVKAHRAGVSQVDQMYKVPIREKADIVIASAGGFPKDINLYQAHKALDNAGYAVRDGGIIILVAECADGLGSKTFEKWIMKSLTPDDVIGRLRRNFVIGGHKAFYIAQLTKKAKIFLVSSLPDDVVKKAFMEPYKTIDGALKAAFSYLVRMLE